jgi:hypothetical protein
MSDQANRPMLAARWHAGRFVALLHVLEELHQPSRPIAPLLHRSQIAHADFARLLLQATELKLATRIVVQPRTAPSERTSNLLPPMLRPGQAQFGPSGCPKSDAPRPVRCRSWPVEFRLSRRPAPHSGTRFRASPRPNGNALSDLEVRHAARRGNQLRDLRPSGRAPLVGSTGRTFGSARRDL